MRLAALLGLFLAFPVPAFGGPTKALIQSAPCHRASAWSPEGKPTVETPVVIPAGKVLELARECDTGSMLLQGQVTGQQPLHVAGNVTVEGGSFGAQVPLTLYGFGTLDFGGTQAPAFLVEGADELVAPLDAANVDVKGSLYTNGWLVRVEGSLYPHITQYRSRLWLGTSTVTVAYFVSYPSSETDQQAAEASFVVDAEYRSSGGFHLANGGEGGIFSGAEQQYGNVTLTGVEPESREDYEVLGTLTVRPENGPALFTRGRVVKTRVLAGSGRVEAIGSSPEPAVIECGCAVPAGLELGPGVEVR